MSCPSTAGPCCTHESCMDQPYPCSSVSHVEMAQRWLLGVCISNWLCTIPPNPSPTLSAHQHTLFVCVHTQHMHTSHTHTHTQWGLLLLPLIASHSVSTSIVPTYLSLPLILLCRFWCCVMAVLQTQYYLLLKWISVKEAPIKQKLHVKSWSILISIGC